jgi:hypothetical protein
VGLEYQWKTIFYPQTIIHPPCMGRRASAGELYKPGWCVDRHTRRLTLTGLRLQALRFVVSCLGHHGPVELQAIPSRRERFVPWPPLLWSARKSQDWGAVFFPDLRTLKEGSTAIKREGESAAAQTSIALSSILLNWTLRSSSSVVSSSSFSSARCCWLSPASAVFSQEPPMISCDV